MSPAPPPWSILLLATACGAATGPARPPGPVGVERPLLVTGDARFDELYALAIAEVGAASVESIHAKNFDHGAPVACGGCFETGKVWTYVWTRDTAYATHLGLAVIDPSRARRSMEWKLSERRTGGGTEIVQDTGSGGSWPVSTDRVAWALGARALLGTLAGAEREAFAARALDALGHTLERDRHVVFDATDGLYRGETSFLDWREQTYPPWTANDTLHIGTGYALSTNVVHLEALRLAADLALERGQPDRAARWRGWADALAIAARERFWMPDAGLFASYTASWLAPVPVRRHDLLGSALAILAGVATEAQAASVIARYPHLPFGAPVVWPQEQGVATYHNRGVWPFVTAYWIKAARRVGNAAAVVHGVEALARGAAASGSNMEVFDALTGSAEAPVINSARQLWSIAGYLAMVHDVLFGITIGLDGAVRVAPFVPRALRNGRFRASERLVLDGLSVRGRRLRVVVHLPPASGRTDGAYAVGRVREDAAGFDVELVDRADAAPAPTIREIDPSDDAAIFARGPSAHPPKPVLADPAPLEVADGTFVARGTGAHAVQILGDNPGPVDTGITCAVRRVRVLEEPGGRVVAEGHVFLPHGGHESSPLRATLQQGLGYRVVVDEDAAAVNMSAFVHFARYTADRGGTGGAENTLTLRAVRVSRL